MARQLTGIPEPASPRRPRSAFGGGAVGRSGPVVRRRAAGGFTLFELLLVLALIVVVAALTLPAFTGPLENHRLRQAGDLIRAQWNRARVQAMKSGRPQIFRCQLGGGQYTVEPWYRGEDALELSAVEQGIAGSGRRLQSPVVPQTVIQLEELPQHIIFALGDALQDTRSQTLEQQAVQPLASLGDNLTQWSSPILFYPDGTSSTAELMLANRRGNYVVLRLRGLTGLSQVSELLTAAELGR